MSIDFSARKIAEAALRGAKQAAEDTEAQYELVISMISEIIWRYDVNDRGEHVGSYISPVADRMLGLPVGTIGESFEKYLSYVYPDDLPAVRETIFEVIQTLGKDKTVEYRLRKADGTTIFVQSKSSAYWQPEGATSVYGTISDITEQKRATEALRESEERFRTIFESSQDALMILVPPSWKFTSGNKAAVVLFGAKDKTELTTLGSWDVSPERQPDGQLSADKAREMIETAIREGSHFFEWMHKHICGEAFPCTVLLTRMEMLVKTVIQATVRDISAQKKAEEALRQEKELAQLYLEIVGTIVIAISSDHTVSLVNQVGCRLLGYREDEIIGTNWFSRFLPARAKADVEEIFNHLMAGIIEPVRNVEGTVLTRNGEERIVSWHNTILRDEAGNITGTLSSGEDITERKRMEEALRESEDKFRTLFNSTSIAIFIHDFEGHFIEVNQAACEQLGYTHDELVQMTPMDIDPPEHAAQVSDRIEEVIRLGHKVFESAQVRRDGTLIPVEMNVRLIDYKRGKAILCVARDITERTQAEKKLKESEEKYRLLINNASESIIVAQDGLLKFVNPMTLSLLGGYSEQELIDRPFPEFIHPDDRSMVVENYRRRIANEAVRPLYAFRVVTRDGIVKWVEINATLIEWQGKPATLNFLSDITERKRVEEALRESEEKLSLFMRYSPNLVYIKDEDTRAVVLSHHFENILGKPLSQLLGKTCEELWPPEFAAEMRADDEKVMKEGRTIEREETFEGRYYSSVKFPISIPDRPTILGGYTIDITERKQAEEALQKEHQRLTGIIKGTNVGTWEWNVQTGETIFNDRWAEIIGYTLDEISPVSIETWMKCAHPDDIKASDELLEKHFRGELDYYEFESRMKHKDGNWVWVLDRGKVISWTEDGKPLMMMGTHQNITEQKRAAEALQESEKRYRRLSEDMPVFVMTFLPDGTLTYLNETLATWDDVTPAEKIIGRNFFDLLSLAEREMIRARLGALTPEQPTETHEQRSQRPDGGVVYHEWTNRAFFNADGQPTYYQGIGMNIPERKQAEEALIEYSEHLEEIVEERTKQLQNAVRLAALGEMATMIGHDLRNPLQVIVSMVYLAKKMLPPAGIPLLEGRLSFTEILDDIEKSSNSMNMIVSDLQSYAGPQILEFRETDIHKLISDAISVLEIPMGVEVSIEVENGLSEITIDPEKIKRVILNLVNNSIQSMPKGGQITITVIRKGESVVLTIKDEGVGIPSENIPKLLLPLFTTKAKGIGLGLAICKRLVETHRGNIVVTSKVNAGTEVTIEIPQDEKTWTRS